MASPRLIFRTIILCLMGFLFGCASHPQLYDGPKLPPDKVAVIKGYVGGYGSTNISILSVDGKEFDIHAESVEVLPGRHALVVHYFWPWAGGREGQGPLSVETRAGKTYQLNAKKSDDGRYVSISLREEPIQEEEFNCRIEGLVFREFGIQRDQGQTSRFAATEAVRKTFTGLAVSEQTAANLALGHSELITDMVYQLKELRPDTLAIYGANACQMSLAGDLDPQHPQTLAKLSLACQNQYSSPADNGQLHTCIATEAIRLVRKPQ